MSRAVRFLWWDDFRYTYRANARRLALYADANAYAPLLTVTGLPSNQFTNAPLWSGDGETTVTFADTAAGRGQQFANAYLHAMRFLMGDRLDGSVPFCVFPNGWGYAVADLTSTANDSTDWITDRATYERLSRHDDDLLPATYLGETVLPRQRGSSGYAENGIAANYTWWVDFFTAAKAYIDAAVGHTLTPLEVYDDCETQGPNMSTFLSRINATEAVHRTIDVIQADARWDTELVNGTQTWADFYATLTSGERAQLENASNTSVFADALTLVAEKLTVFRDTCHAWQVDQSLGRAARAVWGDRFRFICEYGIQSESATLGTLNDRTSAELEFRMFESRGPLTLPSGWAAAPVSYQLYGLRDSATLGNMDILALVGGYTSTGSRDEDGRLFNKARMVENVRRIRAFDVDVVPWMTYNRYAGADTGIVVADDMTPADHLEVIDAWAGLGVERAIYWGDPTEDAWETDFGPFVDDVMPNMDQPVAYGIPSPGSVITGLFTKLCTVRRLVASQDALGMGTQTLGTTDTYVPCSLQAMSTGRSMIYKAEGQTNVWDLYLPTRIENGSDLVLPVGVQCVVDGVTYRSIGTGLVQGTGGVQMVPVERLAR